MSLGLAFRAFFAALFRPAQAQRIKEALAASAAIEPPQAERVSAKEATGEVATHRNDAITLVGTLQREARFLDLVQEPLDGYTDAQVGAAARDVLRDTAKVLNRCFGIEKLVAMSEGERVELPQSLPAARWRVVGPTPTSKATLIHAGWRATRCQLPQWSGKADDAMVIAPAEIEA